MTGIPNELTDWTPPPATRASWPKGKRPSGLSAIAETVLSYVHAAGGQTGDMNEQIADACRMSPRSVRNACAELEPPSLLRREGNGRNRTLVVVTDDTMAGAAA